MNKKSIFVFLVAISFGWIVSCADSNKNDGEVVVSDSIPKEIGELNKLILNDPNNANLYSQRSNYYFNKKQLSEALVDIQRAIKLDSLNSNYYLTLSEIYFVTNKTSASKEMLEKSISIDPKNSEALLKLAELLFYVKKYDQSIQYLDQALMVDQTIAKAYFLKGMNFAEKGDTAKALSSMQTAVEQDQEYYTAYMQLGLLCAAIKNPLAADYYDNALRIKPNSEEALYDKAKFFQDMNQLENAKKEYEKLLLIYPTNENVLYNLGVVYLLKEDYRSAFNYFTQVINNDEKNANAYYARGTCYQALGDFKKALVDYTTTLQLEPQHEAALNSIKKIKRN